MIDIEILSVPSCLGGGLGRLAKRKLDRGLPGHMS